MRGLKCAMDKRVSVDDLRVFYNGQLVAHNNKPVFVKQITGDRIARILDILTQKEYSTKEIDEITPPMRRIGMVNSCGSVVYVERQPHRKMNMGLYSGNTNVQHLPVEYPEGREITQARVSTFNCVEVGVAYMDKYPTLKECIKHVKEFGGAMAFDHQFCIDEEFRILYKTYRVGTLPRNCSTVEKIEFDLNHSYLSGIIGGLYEKDLATFGKTCTR